MTLDQNTLTYILGIIALFSTAFIVWNKINNPQKKLEKAQALAEKEAQGKTHLLAEQFQWHREETERRFIENAKAIAETNTTTLNHVHTIDIKVDGLVTAVHEMHLGLTKEIAILQTEVSGIKRILDKD